MGFAHARVRRGFVGAVLLVGTVLLGAPPALAAPAHHRPAPARREHAVSVPAPPPAAAAQPGAAQDPLGGLISGILGTAGQILEQTQQTVHRIVSGLTHSGSGTTPPTASPTPSAPSRPPVTSAPTRPPVSTAPSTPPVRTSPPAAPEPSATVPRSSAAPRPGRIRPPAAATTAGSPKAVGTPQATPTPVTSRSAAVVAGRAVTPTPRADPARATSVAASPHTSAAPSGRVVVALPRGRTPVDALAAPIAVLGAALGVGPLPVVLLGVVMAAGAVLMFVGTRRRSAARS